MNSETAGPRVKQKERTMVQGNDTTGWEMKTIILIVLINKTSIGSKGYLQQSNTFAFRQQAISHANRNLCLSFLNAIEIYKEI